MKKQLVLATVFLSSGFSMLATTIAPSGGLETPLPAATFSGTGINNTEVEQTTTSSGASITLGLTATPRYFNPALSDDMHGTYTATTGENTGFATPPQTPGPTWNFDYYINLTETPGATVTPVHFVLLYANNKTGVEQTFDFGTSSTSETLQDSWNLGFSFLSGIGFDPNAAGAYGFELEALDANSDILASTAINVNVTSVPEASSTLSLMGLALTGLAGFGYFRNRKVATVAAK